jgi:DNA polymerase-3 subunit alpha
MSYVHLHVHSQFSILDGTATVDALVERAAALGMPALALTDTANLYGAVAFAKACKAAGIRPVFGAELHVQPEGIAVADPAREEGGYQIVALVENAQGYTNLCRLVTAGIFDGMAYKPRIDLELLQRHRQGLVILTGGSKGVLGRVLQRGDERAARRQLQDLAAALDPEQWFVELQDLGLPGGEELALLAREVAHAHGRPLVITNAVHYLEAGHAPIHDLLNAIGTGASLSDPTRLTCPTDQAWFKSAEEMAALFPDDAEALARTLEIAERCDFAFDFGTYHFPAATPPDTAPDTAPDAAESAANWSYFLEAFPPPIDFGVPAYEAGTGHLDGYFAWYAKRGLERRLTPLANDAKAPYEHRLAFEIEMISRMGFPAYLLIVAEFINWAKDRGIPVGPGRGSAAGSLVAWAMRITDIDPLRFGLLFERFLNPERVTMPDIDVDFAQDRREEVITHVRDKYGADYVSQIITYGTLKAKAAVRDVARSVDLNFQEADRIAKLVPDQLGITLSEALDQEPRLRDLRDGDPRVRRVLALAEAIEGTVRQTGVHAAGVVISDRPLLTYAPLYRDEPEGGPVLQFDMKSAEAIGLVKFDFLGLKTLDQMRDTVRLVRENHGVDIDLLALPEDDEAAYTLLCDGDALGLFQLESSGMRELLGRLRPSSMDDMVALVALYRPGPLQSGMVDDYVERKHGRIQVEYPLPALQPILEPTYGTIVYQEQVMQIAQLLAGYSLGEADLLRKAMGKKNPVEMAAQRSRFVDGAVERGLRADKAVEIFELMAKFAAYGFNKSHSAAYGYIAYQTAWLKARYRPEFMASLMSIESASADKVLTYVLDCRRAGIRVLPVCVNHSNRSFAVPAVADRPLDDDGHPVGVIRFGLGAVRNAGDAAIDAILEARAAAGGAFASTMDFFERIDHRRVNRRVLENLVKAGALDTFGVRRSALLQSLETVTSLAARAQEDKAAGQIGLFAMTPRPATFRFPDVPEWPLSQRLAYEKEVLGIYLSGHPMQAHAEDVVRYHARPIAALLRADRLGAAGAEDDNTVRAIGMVVDTRIVRTRRNDRMAFVRLEDADASIECVFFADAFARSARALESQEPVLVTGRLEPGDETKIVASTAELLSDVRARTTREVQFTLEVDDLTGERLDRFMAVLATQRGGCRSRLVLAARGRYEAELALPQLPVEPSTALQESVVALFGRPGVVQLL